MDTYWGIVLSVCINIQISASSLPGPSVGSNKCVLWLHFMVNTGRSDCQMNTSDVRCRCLNHPDLNVLIDRIRKATWIMSAVSWKWPVNSSDVVEIKHSELEQSTVRPFGIQRKFHLSCKQTAGRVLIHLTLTAHSWPTRIFTCVSGLPFQWFSFPS